MIVKQLNKNSKGLYETIIDNNEYLLYEQTVLEFRLYQGKEIDSIKEILKFNDERLLYSKALNYALKYNKNSSQIKKYLLTKDFNLEDINIVVDELIEKRIINDQIIANNLASSLARNSNGPLLIKQKLKEKGFDYNVILTAIESVNEEEYELGLSKLKNKFNNRYKSDNDTVRKLKIKKQLYNHGYNEG